MKNIIVIAHISLDRFVANQNGGFESFEAGDEKCAFVSKIPVRQIQFYVEELLTIS